MATEEKPVFLKACMEKDKRIKPKCQAILSLIGYCQHNQKHIQRAHLIRALVKNPDLGSVDIDVEEVEVADQQQVPQEMEQIMFTSVANLDKKLKKLRKLGLITNQYIRGYPRLILTEKGRAFFYTFLYSSVMFKVISELINKFH